MKNILTSISVLICLLTSGFSQNNNLVFNVSKNKGEVSVIPSYKYLIYNVQEKISIKTDNSNLELKLELKGGEVLISNTDTMLLAKNTNGKGVLLNIYDISKGTDRLIHSITYDVVQPKLYMGDTELTESTTLKGLLKDSATYFQSFSQPFNLKANYKGENITFELLSFSIVAQVNGDIKSVYVKGNLLNQKQIKFVSHFGEYYTGKSMVKRLYIEKIIAELRHEKAIILSNRTIKLVE